MRFRMAFSQLFLKIFLNLYAVNSSKNKQDDSIDNQIEELGNDMKNSISADEQGVILKKKAELLFEKSAIDPMYLSKAIEVMTEALEKFEMSENDVLRSETLNALGNLHKHNNRPMKAYEFYKLASEIANDLDIKAFIEAELNRCVLCCQKLIKKDFQFILMAALEDNELTANSCCYEIPKEIAEKATKTGNNELGFIAFYQFFSLGSYVLSTKNEEVKSEIKEQIAELAYKLLIDPKDSDYKYLAARTLINRISEMLNASTLSGTKKVYKWLSECLQNISATNDPELIFYSNYYIGISRLELYNEPEEAISNFKLAFVIGSQLDKKNELNSIISNLSELYIAIGQYDNAKKIINLAIKMAENNLDKTTVWHMILGNIADIEGNYAEALVEYNKALNFADTDNNIREQAEVRYNMSFVYKNIGDYNKAKELLLQSLNYYAKNIEEIIEFKESHPIPPIKNYADYYVEKDKEFIEALANNGITKVDGNLSIVLNQMWNCYSELGSICLKEGNFDDSKEYFLKSAKIYQRTTLTHFIAFPKVYGDAGTTIGLIKLSIMSEDVNAAKEYFDYYNNNQKSSDLISKQPIFQIELLLLEGDLEFLKGNLDKSELLYEKALNMVENLLGKEHPTVISCLNKLAQLYVITDKHYESHNLYKRSANIENIIRDNIFQLFPERKKLNYVNQNESRLFKYISHTIGYLRNNDDAIKDAFNSWLKWKGVVMESQERYINALSYSNNILIKQKFEELTIIRRKIISLQLSKPERMEIEDYVSSLSKLNNKREEVESELSKLSKNYNIEKMIQKANVDNIVDIIPKDSIYIDFVKMKNYDFKKNKWSDSKYLAFLLSPDKSIEIADLGYTEEIDALINDYRTEIIKAENTKRPPVKKKLDTISKILYSELLKPLEKHFNGINNIYISPDGNLNLLPFEILITTSKEYIIDKYLVNYIAAGRDIIRFIDKTSTNNKILIMADPDYDMTLKEKRKKENNLNDSLRRRFTSIDGKTLEFIRLPHTKEEADAIEIILKKKDNFIIKNYQNTMALEERLLEAESPTILHIATHGYFFKDENIRYLQSWKFSVDIDKLEEIEIENPMLRSGIVLAGVNTSLKLGKDNGVVSSEKILGLNLKNTELVVLSACDTGIGKVQSGEGVFGLKRAFILSGAKTMVMSLWGVSSKETKNLMVDFYTLLSEGKSKCQAFRLAKLKMKKKKENPFFWAPFIMIGKPE